jgi:hypothetical protein
MLTITSTWKLNYGQLRGDEKVKLDTHIRRWDDLIKLMNCAIDTLNEPMMTEEDWEFVRLVAVDVDAFVAEYPATSDPLYQAIQNAGVEHMEYAPLQEKLKGMPTMFRLYGVPCDFVHAPCYKYFIWKIQERQRKQRQEAAKAETSVPGAADLRPKTCDGLEAPQRIPGTQAVKAKTEASMGRGAVQVAAQTLGRLRPKSRERAGTWAVYRPVRSATYRVLA